MASCLSTSLPPALCLTVAPRWSPASSVPHVALFTAFLDFAARPCYTPGMIGLIFAQDNEGRLLVSEKQLVRESEAKVGSIFLPTYPEKPDPSGVRRDLETVSFCWERDPLSGTLVAFAEPKGQIDWQYSGMKPTTAEQKEMARVLLSRLAKPLPD